MTGDDGIDSLIQAIVEQAIKDAMRKSKRWPSVTARRREARRWLKQRGFYILAVYGRLSDDFKARFVIME